MLVNAELIFDLLFIFFLSFFFFFEEGGGGGGVFACNKNWY